jgi:nitroreductase
MDILEAIITRRSIRKYADKPVTDEMIEKLLKAAMYAPSAVNKQPWHFVVFRNPETMLQVMRVHPNAAMLKDAGAAILVCWDENLQHDAGYGPVDCAAATQNILLAAHGIGLGAVWVGIYPRPHRIESIHQIFHLPAHVKPFAIVSIGYPAEKKAIPERFIRTRIHLEKW